MSANSRKSAHESRSARNRRSWQRQRAWLTRPPPLLRISLLSYATARQRLEERVVVGPHDDVADQREFEALGDDSQLSQERAAILAARKQIALVTGARRLWCVPARRTRGPGEGDLRFRSRHRLVRRAQQDVPGLTRRSVLPCLGAVRCRGRARGSAAPGRGGANHVVERVPGSRRPLNPRVAAHEPPALRRRRHNAPASPRLTALRFHAQALALLAPHQRKRRRLGGRVWAAPAVAGGAASETLCPRPQPRRAPAGRRRRPPRAGQVFAANYDANRCATRAQVTTAHRART